MIEHPFLDQFPPRRQSFVHGLFWYAHTADDWVHLPKYAKTTDINEMLRRIQSECDDRIETEWMSAEMKTDCGLLKETLSGDDAREFAQWVVDYENDRTMASQTMVKPKSIGATDPQRAFLKQLGYMKYDDGNLTKNQASEIIGRLKK